MRDSRSTSSLPVLPLVEKYLATNGMSARRFGMAAMRDPNFVFDLRDGRKIRAATIDKVMDFIVRGEAA